MSKESILQSVRVYLFHILLLVLAPAVHAQAIPVEVVELEGGGWQLLRGGEPYFIKGAGGSGSKQNLADAGGNTFPDLGRGTRSR